MEFLYHLMFDFYNQFPNSFPLFILPSFLVRSYLPVLADILKQIAVSIRNAVGYFDLFLAFHFEIET